MINKIDELETEIEKLNLMDEALKFFKKKLMKEDVEKYLFAADDLYNQNDFCAYISPEEYQWLYYFLINFKTKLQENIIQEEYQQENPDIETVDEVCHDYISTILKESQQENVILKESPPGFFLPLDIIPNINHGGDCLDDSIIDSIEIFSKKDDLLIGLKVELLKEGEIQFYFFKYKDNNQKEYLSGEIQIYIAENSREALKKKPVYKEQKNYFTFKFEENNENLPEENNQNKEKIFIVFNEIKKKTYIN